MPNSCPICVGEHGRTSKDKYPRFISHDSAVARSHLSAIVPVMPLSRRKHGFESRWARHRRTSAKFFRPRGCRRFFGSNGAAQAEGRQTLFAAGDRTGVRKDPDAAVGAGLGGLGRSRRFRFRSTVLARLPPRLRVLVGCAEVLKGGVAACDFVDVDLEASEPLRRGHSGASHVEMTRDGLSLLVMGVQHDTRGDQEDPLSQGHRPWERR